MMETTEETQLVACVTTIDKTEVEKCDFEEGKTLTIYNADFEVKLYEAKTGDLVSETVLHLTLDECPTYWMFSDENAEKLPDNEQPIIDFLKEYIVHENE